MNRTDNKGYTATCKHPTCNWHSAHGDRKELRESAEDHIRATGMRHTVAIFASEMAVHTAIHNQSGLSRDIHTDSGRAVLETIVPRGPLEPEWLPEFSG
jgi:hypothetical protein